MGQHSLKIEWLRLLPTGNEMTDLLGRNVDDRGSQIDFGVILDTRQDKENP